MTSPQVFLSDLPPYRNIKKKNSVQPDAIFKWTAAVANLFLAGYHLQSIRQGFQRVICFTHKV